jgi:CheY-like chemotaxis protein
VLKTLRPLAIVLDILLEHENSWGFLADLKRDKETREIPVYVVTMVENENKARNTGADDFHLKPIERDWLLGKLGALNAEPFSKKLLVIDDNEVARYLFRGLLSTTPVRIIESAGGHDGVRAALEEQPDAVFLDLDMPDMNGFDVLNQLYTDPRGRNLPIIFYTANAAAIDLAKDFDSVVGVLSKDFSSREATKAQLLELLGKAEHHKKSNS